MGFFFFLLFILADVGNKEKASRNRSRLDRAALVPTWLLWNSREDREAFTETEIMPGKAIRLFELIQMFKKNSHWVIYWFTLLIDRPNSKQREVPCPSTFCSLLWKRSLERGGVNCLFRIMDGRNIVKPVKEEKNIPLHHHNVCLWFSVDQLREKNFLISLPTLPHAIVWFTALSCAAAATLEGNCSGVIYKLGKGPYLVSNLLHNPSLICTMMSHGQISINPFSSSQFVMMKIYNGVHLIWT